VIADHDADEPREPKPPRETLLLELPELLLLLLLLLREPLYLFHVEVEGPHERVLLAARDCSSHSLGSPQSARQASFDAYEARRRR
jgi:hypothetical protein